MGREGFQIGSLEELIDRRPTAAQRPLRPVGRRLAKPLAALLLLLLVLPAALSLTGRRQPPAAAFQGRPAGRPLAAARSGSPAGPHRQKPSPRQAQRRARPAPAKLAGQPARAGVWSGGRPTACRRPASPPAPRTGSGGRDGSPLGKPSAAGPPRQAAGACAGGCPRVRL